MRLLLAELTPLWVAALWWLSVSLVMSLAALTQVICMRADSGGDVQQRQWCTYHFPQWLIEDCNLWLDFLSDYTCLREENKDSELPLGTGLIQGFQPSRGVKSAFKVSSIFLPFILLLQVSDRMHLVDSGQTVAVWGWDRNWHPRSFYSHIQLCHKCKSYSQTEVRCHEFYRERWWLRMFKMPPCSPEQQHDMRTEQGDFR